MTAVLVLLTLFLIVALMTVIYIMLDEDYFELLDPRAQANLIQQPTMVLVEDLD